MSGVMCPICRGFHTDCGKCVTYPLNFEGSGMLPKKEQSDEAIKIVLDALAEFKSSYITSLEADRELLNFILNSVLRYSRKDLEEEMRIYGR